MANSEAPEASSLSSRELTTVRRKRTLQALVRASGAIDEGEIIWLRLSSSWVEMTSRSLSQLIAVCVKSITIGPRSLRVPCIPR